MWSEDIVLYEPFDQISVNLMDWFDQIGSPVEISLKSLIESFTGRVVFWGSRPGEEMINTLINTSLVKMSEEFGTVVGEYCFDLGLKHCFHCLQKSFCRNGRMA